MQILTAILAFTGLASALALPAPQKEDNLDLTVGGINHIIGEAIQAKKNYDSIRAGNGDLPHSGPVLVRLEPGVVHVTKIKGGNGAESTIAPYVEPEDANAAMQFLDDKCEA